MLHFPSTNTAAHTAAPADVHRLDQLLGDHVWAFSNCRVDAPGFPVAEVDWLFYNATRGTFILSEWKRYPAAVSRVRDVGEPWVLVTGATVPNPVEQVARQLDAVRRVLRQVVAKDHFPSADLVSVNPFQSVYSPQVGPATQEERLRFGAVHGSLEELARTIETRSSPVPLVVAADVGRAALAETLAALFRCAVSTVIRRKLATGTGTPRTPSRVAAIHRELAALHLELAALAEQELASTAAPAPAAAAVPMRPAAAVAPPKAPAGAPAAEAPPPAAPPVAGTPTRTTSVSGHLRRHVVKHVPPSAGPEHVRAAFLAALQDGQLRASGVHVGQFGALVGQRLDRDRKLASLALGGLVTWCLAQAAAAGVGVVKDPVDPSVVRLAPSA
ncbi:hypothetical protein [Arthrobacter bussei]|uniref:hypothetical protein n=1 Tax=Arthrobacter bussei TaxID=2594179 RepID=UPI0017836C80|nr:hypothetical protein [Arthrobacter bussei]